MTILNFIFRKKPKVVIKIRGTNSYIHEDNEYETSSFLTTTNIYFAKSYDLKQAHKVVSIIGSEIYEVLQEGEIK